MAKPIISSNLRNMKFMQRASQKEEKPIKAEEEVVVPEGNFPSSTVKNCVVIMEGDPHPGAIKGRMSFLSFNPSIDKLNDEASNWHQPEASATFSGRQSETVSDGDRNGFPKDDGPERIKQETSSYGINGDLKRRQAEEASEAQYPNKSPRNSKTQKESSGHNNRSWQKQPKNEKLDWNVLRPPKSQSKKKK